MEYSDIRLCWALMPLPEDELSKIPVGHTIRPYLLLKEDDGFYWAFPTTSKAFNNKSRYVNSTLRVNGFSYIKSLVMLDKVHKLPFDNMKSSMVCISKREENMLFKRLKANIKFSDYPDEVIDFINNRTSDLECNDLVSHNDELYLIVGKVPEKNIYYSLKVYNYEVDGTVLKIVDTNKYYVDCNNIHCIVPNDNTEYVSVMYGFSYGCFEKSNEDLKLMIEDLQQKEKVVSTLVEDDFKVFCRLPIGVVISYVQDDVNYRMIILDRDDTNTTVIFGLEDQKYKYFQVGTFPNDYNFMFSIVGTLDDNRVMMLKEKKLSNINKVDTLN